MLFLFLMRIDIYHFSCSRNAKLYFVKVFSFVKINCTSVIGRKAKGMKIDPLGNMCLWVTNATPLTLSVCLLTCFCNGP